MLGPVSGHNFIWKLASSARSCEPPSGQILVFNNPKVLIDRVNKTLNKLRREEDTRGHCGHIWKLQTNRDCVLNTYSLPLADCCCTCCRPGEECFRDGKNTALICRQISHAHHSFLPPHLDIDSRFINSAIRRNIGANYHHFHTLVGYFPPRDNCHIKFIKTLPQQRSNDLDILLLRLENFWIALVSDFLDFNHH